MPVPSAHAPSLHIAIVSCTRKHTYELGPNLLSLATHAPEAHVHLFADAPGRDALAPCLDHFKTRFKSLDVHDVAADLGAPLIDYNANVGASPRLQSSKFACASAKLMLQGAPPLRRAQFVLALVKGFVASGRRRRGGFLSGDVGPWASAR